MDKDPNEHVAELEARLAQLRDERDDVAGGLEQIDTQLGAMTAAGEQSDSEDLDELRRERAVDVQRLHELDAAIPSLERQLDEARAAATKAEQQARLREAWSAAAERAELADAIDSRLAEIGPLWDRLVEATERENAALRAAGHGTGTSMTMLNRLQWIIPTVLWKHCSSMLAAARFERIPVSRWQSLKSFVDSSRPPRSDADAA